MLARSGVSIATIALYEFLFFLSNLASFFWINGGRNAVLAAWKANDITSARELPPGTLGLYFLAGALAGGAIWLGSPWFMDWAPESANTSHFALLATLTFLTIPGSLGETWLLLDRRYATLLRLSTLTQAATLAAVALPLALGYDLTVILAGLVMMQAFRVLWLVWDLKAVTSTQEVRTAWAGASAFLWFALPYLGHAILGGLMDYVDSALILNLFPDPTQFALFRYGAREVPLSMLLVGGVVTALVPGVREDLAGTLARIRENMIKLSHWLFPASCLLALASPLLFHAVYGEPFMKAAIFFNIYLLVLPSRILMPQIILYGQGHRRALLAIGGLEVLTNAVLSVFLAQFTGISGIVWATVIAFALGKLLMIAYVRHRTNIPSSRYVPWRLFTVYTFLLLLSFTIGDILHFGS